MKKQVFFGGLLIALSVLFILIPASPSDLIIRIYFDDIEGDACRLYYMTDNQNGFSEEQSVASQIDYNEKKVEFRFDGTYDGHLTMFRLDWPQEAEQLICIKNIAVSSGGVIQKEYSPCEFFEDKNITFMQEVVISRVYPKKRTYMRIGAEDPYVVLSEELTRDIQSHYSQRRISRLCLCVFIAGCFVISKKKIFT